MIVEHAAKFLWLLRWVPAKKASKDMLLNDCNSDRSSIAAEVKNSHTITPTVCHYEFIAGVEAKEKRI